MIKKQASRTENRLNYRDYLSMRTASRKNDDGTTAFVTLAPGRRGMTFVVEDKDAKSTLTLRDGQHEYVFTEAESAAAKE